MRDLFPRSLMIFGHTIKVEIVPDLPDNDYGTWDFDSLTIKVRRHPIPSVQAHSFWHEIVHIILEMAGKPELSTDEGFVDCLAGVLHQVTSTMQWATVRRRGKRINTGH